MAKKELKASISLPNDNYNDENTSYDQQSSVDSTTYEISTLNGYYFSQILVIQHDYLFFLMLLSFIRSTKFCRFHKCLQVGIN
jgi:hypothetical protein